MREMQMTADQRSFMLGLVRAGAFVWVAAEAAGLRAEVVQEWLWLGDKPDGPEPYQTFTREVKTAAAQARARAEVEMLKRSPGQWLRYGPGREMWGMPGWTSAEKPPGNRKPAGYNDWAGIQVVMEALEEFPEAQRKAREALRRSRRAEDGIYSFAELAEIYAKQEAEEAAQSAGSAQDCAGFAQDCVNFVQELRAQTGGAAAGGGDASDGGAKACENGPGGGEGRDGGEKRGLAGEGVMGAGSGAGEGRHTRQMPCESDDGVKGDGEGPGSVPHGGKV